MEYAADRWVSVALSALESLESARIWKTIYTDIISDLLQQFKVPFEELGAIESCCQLFSTPFSVKIVECIREQSSAKGISRVAG